MQGAGRMRRNVQSEKKLDRFFAKRKRVEEKSPKSIENKRKTGKGRRNGYKLPNLRSAP